MKNEIQKRDLNKLQKKDAHQFMKYIGTIETKSLNNLGRFLIIGTYTFLIVFSTALYFTNQSNNHFNEELRNEIYALKVSQENYNKELVNKLQSSIQQRSYASSAVDIESRIINQLNKKIDATDSYTSKKIEDQKQEIYNLKQKLKSVLLLSQSSPKTFKDKKSMSYSQENYDILYYEHGQVLKRLKVKHAEVEQAYMSLYDMTTPKHQKAFNELKDKNKLEYYSQKTKLSKIRSQFRKDKYLVLADND